MFIHIYPHIPWQIAVSFQFSTHWSFGAEGQIVLRTFFPEPHFTEQPPQGPHSHSPWHSFLVSHFFTSGFDLKQLFGFLLQWRVLFLVPNPQVTEHGAHCDHLPRCRHLFPFSFRPSRHQYILASFQFLSLIFIKKFYIN